MSLQDELIKAMTGKLGQDEFECRMHDSAKAYKE